MLCGPHSGRSAEPASRSISARLTPARHTSSAGALGPAQACPVLLAAIRGDSRQIASMSLSRHKIHLEMTSEQRHLLDVWFFDHETGDLRPDSARVFFLIGEELLDVRGDSSG